MGDHCFFQEPMGMKFQVNQLILFMTVVWTFPPRNWGGFVFLAQERPNHPKRTHPWAPWASPLGSRNAWGAEKLLGWNIMRRGSVTSEAYPIWACSHDISEDHADHRVRLVRSPNWRLEKMVISSNWFISHLLISWLLSTC